MNIFSVPDVGVFSVFTIQEICPLGAFRCKSGRNSAKVVILVTDD